MRGKYKAGKKGEKCVAYVDVEEMIEIIFLMQAAMYFKEFGMFCLLD